MSQRKACGVNPCLSLILLSMLLLAGVAWGQSGTLSSTTFGMQCGQSSGECLAQSGTITLPTEPGTLRLWDSEVGWSGLNTANGVYNWTILDKYLHAIYADTSLSNVIYTFGNVPCWDGGCPTGKPDPNTWPPSDLKTTLNCTINGITYSGSCTFDNFVNALTTHCTSAAPVVCVKDVVKYYELWNEANSPSYWNPTLTNSQQQLYSLVAPGAAIINRNVTLAKILTPSVSVTPNGESWMASWLTTEVGSGIISKYYNFHTYLETYSPEARWQNVVAAGTSGSPGMLYPNYHTTGWTALPWLISETNFTDASYNPPYTCTGFTTADCQGQIVRWQALLNSNGAVNLSWYKWNSTIGDLGSGTNYATPYYHMMQYMVGGKFTSACSYSGSGTVIATCPFTDKNSNADLWVWTNSESPQSYTPTGYGHYWDIFGSYNTIPQSGFTVTDQPYLLVK